LGHLDRPAAGPRQLRRRGPERLGIAGVGPRPRPPPAAALAHRLARLLRAPPAADLLALGTRGVARFLEGSAYQIHACKVSQLVGRTGHVCGLRLLSRLRVEGPLVTCLLRHSITSEYRPVSPSRMPISILRASQSPGTSSTTAAVTNTCSADSAALTRARRRAVSSSANTSSSSSTGSLPSAR